MGRLLERYSRGDHVEVWAELTSLGGAVRRSPDLLREAQDVAAETMRRARANVEALVEGLPALGYRFGQPGVTRPSPAFVPAASDVSVRLDHLEERVGPLPLSLRAWMEQVGDVNLCGVHPDWAFDYTDALTVEAPLDYLTDEYDLWEQDRGTEFERGAFTLDFAPDALHKANLSGGAPYATEIPNSGADGPVLWERHQTTFVAYLRLCFEFAGMPGWGGGQEHAWERPPRSIPGDLLALAGRMLPL